MKTRAWIVVNKARKMGVVEEEEEEVISQFLVKPIRFRVTVMVGEEEEEEEGARV